MKPSIGVIGLRVMGSNLARNIASRGYPVAVFNRDGVITAEFIRNFGKEGFTASSSLEEFVDNLRRPRQIFMMIQAGPPVDSVMQTLLPLLDRGDVLIDGGNSFYEDTQRREKAVRPTGVYFLGVGVSGGEEGALKGPSIMPGGPKEGWEIVAPLLDKIAAQVDGPCTAYIGPDGAGHFVKMVHNGIEYGDMQLIAEAYHLLKGGLGAAPNRLADIFEGWNSGPLSSFLIEITGKVLRERDPESDGFLVDHILDKAGQKGTGRWTILEALKLGIPVPTLSAAVDARVLSGMKEERVQASSELAQPLSPSAISPDEFISMVHGALYCSKIMAYAQGMALLAKASSHYNWSLRLDDIARIWRGGCIIRARFLDDIRNAFHPASHLNNLMLAPGIKQQVLSRMDDLRRTVAFAASAGIPVPAFTASLSYFDSYRSAWLPQNLTQAQRDYFGAHTYERTDRDGTFHTKWSS